MSILSADIFVENQLKNDGECDIIVKIWAKISVPKRRKGGVMKAYLILEDGPVFEGTSIGSAREVISEIVFNTSMTGYLEVLTDPSYAGQAVVMTYPVFAVMIWNRNVHGRTAILSESYPEFPAISEAGTPSIIS